MCRMMSGIITLNKTIYDLDNDSHEALIQKEGLKDEGEHPDFVRVEIVPKDGDVFNHDLKNWELCVDQDFKPDWFNKEFALVEMQKAVQELWAERFLIDDKSGKVIKEGRWFLKNSHAVLWGSSHAVLWGSSHAELRESSHAVLRESSNAVLLESSHAELWGSSHAVLRGSSRAVLLESSHAELRESSQGIIPYSKDVVIKSIHDQASVKDLSGKPIIYVADSKLKTKVWKAPKVKKVKE